MSSTIFSGAWVKGAGERAIKSFVQGGITGLLGSGVINAADAAAKVPDFLALPWYAALSTGLTMGILSIGTSVMQSDFTAGTPTGGGPNAATAEAEPDDQEVDEDEPDEDLEDEQTGIDDDVIIEDDEYPDGDEDASEDVANADHADSDDPDAAPRHLTTGS